MLMGFQEIKAPGKLKSSAFRYDLTTQPLSGLCLDDVITFR